MYCIKVSTEKIKSEWKSAIVCGTQIKAGLHRNDQNMTIHVSIFFTHQNDDFSQIMTLFIICYTFTLTLIG